MSAAVSEPLPEIETVHVVLDALRQAAEAHGIHEAEVLGGEYDAEWPQWYSEHMARTLARGGYTISRTPLWSGSTSHTGPLGQERTNDDD